MRRRPPRRRRRLTSINRMRPINSKRPKLNKGRLVGMSGLILIVVITATIYYSLHNVDEFLMPIVLATFEMRIKNDINTVINSSIENVVSNTNLSASDFFTTVQTEDGQVTSINVNTVLVNSICADVAEYISNHFGNIRGEEVRVPAGSLLGVEAFANIGPRVGIEIKPAGNVTVDYETTFTSVGINQVNFQIWLVINTAVRIVNPPQQSEITLSRKVAIVNTVFSGEVPENFIGGGLMMPILDR